MAFVHEADVYSKSLTALTQEFARATAVNGGKVRYFLTWLWPGMALRFTRKVTDGTGTWHKDASECKVVNVFHGKLVVGGH